MKKLAAIVMCSGLIIVAPDNTMADDSGASTYKLVCSSCHESTVSNAPKLNDKAEWKHRIAQGMDKMYASTVNGKCEVWVKALRKDMSNEDIKAAVDYMVARAR